MVRHRAFENHPLGFRRTDAACGHKRDPCGNQKPKHPHLPNLLFPTKSAHLKNGGSKGSRATGGSLPARTAGSRLRVGLEASTSSRYTLRFPPRPCRLVADEVSHQIRIVLQCRHPRGRGFVDNPRKVWRVHIGQAQKTGKRFLPLAHRHRKPNLLDSPDSVFLTLE